MVADALAAWVIISSQGTDYVGFMIPCHIWWWYQWPTPSQCQLEQLHSEIPRATPWLLILVIHIRSQVKTRQSKKKIQKIAKNSNLEILQTTLHATHPLKVLDKMYKYKMDPTRTVSTTERTQDMGRTSLENLISAAMKQAAPHTCFFFLVFFI